MNKLELLKQELAKERKARIAAEELLEQKVLELSNENQQLVQSYKELKSECEFQTLRAHRIEERFQSIFNKLELGLLETDKDRVITRVYRGFCEMTGYQEEELIGRTTFEVFVPKKNRSKVKKIVFSPEYDFSGILETKILKKDGSPLWILASRVPIYNYRGKLKSVLSINYDITSRKEMEAELAQSKERAENAREVEKEFLAKMSHEIRTPLNAIIGMAHLLSDTENNPIQSEYISDIMVSGNMLLKLISDILDLSKIEAGEVQTISDEFDLVGLVNSVCKTFQLKIKNRDLVVKAYIDERIENNVIGDELQLTQVLMNLVGNAVKFTNQGSVIVHVDLESEHDGKYNILFSVVDTGIGIAADKCDLIFENFKQTDEKVRQNYGGTGLGLAISKQLVELQGGKIWVESELGDGATFKFRLSYLNSGNKFVPREETQVMRQNFGSSGRRFLIVEDNYMNRKYITTLIKKWGFDYVEAFNGKEGVIAAQKQKFDLIFMDVSMPIMDGYEATIHIRNQSNPNQKTPIIAITASAFISKKDLALESGMTDYMGKPFEPSQLLAMIKKHTSLEPITKSIESSTENFQFSNELDVEYLKKIYETDYEYATDMFGTFLDHALNEFWDLEPLIKSGSWSKVRSLAHKLKPTFAMVGLTDIEAKLQAIEKVEKGKEIPNCINIIEDIKESLQTQIPIIKAELTRLEKLIVS